MLTALGNATMVDPFKTASHKYLASSSTKIRKIYLTTAFFADVDVHLSQIRYYKVNDATDITQYKAVSYSLSKSQRILFGESGRS